MAGQILAEVGGDKGSLESILEKAHSPGYVSPDYRWRPSLRHHHPTLRRPSRHPTHRLNTTCMIPMSIPRELSSPKSGVMTVWYEMKVAVHPRTRGNPRVRGFPDAGSILSVYDSVYCEFRQALAGLWMSVGMGWSNECQFDELSSLIAGLWYTGVEACARKSTGTTLIALTERDDEQALRLEI